MLHITFSLVLFSSFFWRYSLSIEAVYVNSYQAPFYDAYNRAVNSQNDDIHRAVEQYKLALSGIPNLEQAHQNIALLYDTLGQTELALRHHYAAEQSSESPRFKALCICNIVSNKLSQLSNRNLAGLQPLLEMLQRAWTLDPLNAQVAMTTAFAYIQVGLHEEAVLSLVELVSSLEPDHTLALLNIGNHYFYKRDYTTAVLFYAKVLHQYLRSSYTTGPDKSYRDDLVSKSLLILNNMGQSYRELGLMRHSHNVLGFAVMEFGLLSAVADPVSGRVLRNSSGVLSDLLRAIRGRRERQRGHMERVLGVTGGSSSPRTVDLNRISAAETPPQHSHLEELHIWSLMNLYSVQGISLFWQKYEVMEELLIAALPVCSSVSLSGGRSSGTDKLSLANDDICFASSASAPRGAPDSIFDPYTYSLMRYSSLDSDDKCLTKDVCKLCWAEPIERVGHGGVAAVESKVKVSLQRPLRVGYLSYDWRDHPMGRLTRHLVTSHNTRHFLNNSGSELFEIFLYSYGPNDGSAIRQFIERASRENVHITLVELFRYKNDRDVAGMIAAAQLDILVDITSHTYNGRIDLAALNPSNVIINYLGYPGTTGCRAFDYSMVDARVVPPESARGFTEKLIYLPYNYQSTAMPLTVPLCWTREDKEGNVMSGVRPSHRSESCRNRLIATIAHTRLLPLSFSTASDHMGNGTRAVFSQQEKERRVRDPNSILICSFNAVKKFEPVSFAAWMNILHRLGSRSLLVLIDIETPFARDNMFNLALFHGISPNRLVFVRKSEWEAHLGRAASCDVVVDNFVYGAHTTASDMIFMGIPVVALESWGSGRMPSRVAAGITRSLFASSSAVASADAAAGEHSLRSRAQAEHKERLHSLMVVQDARQYEDTVIRLLRSRRSDGNGAGTAGVISRLHMNMFSQSLKQPAFNKYLQQYVTERAFFVAQEVYHLRTGLDQASSGALIPYHIAVAPSYYEQIGQMSADGVEALTPKDLCWDVYAAVVSFADGQGVDVDPKEALRWETSMLAVFPEKVAEVVASLSAAPPDELAGAQVQIGTMLCRGVYGQCSMLSAEELSAHSARALHELCSYEQDLASTNPDSHRSESAIESAAVVPGDTSEVAPGSPIFDRLFSGSREDSQRACMSNSAGVGPSISAFDRMFPPSSSSHVAAIDWVHRITDRKAGDDKFIQTDGFIRRHYFGASGGVCLNISKEDVLLLYSSDRSEAARCASEGERGTAKLEEGAVTVGDVRSRLVKLLSHEVESLIISDLYSGTGTGTSTATVAEDTEESASARAGGGQTCTAETAVLVREFLYQLLRAQSELSEMGASFAGVGGCQLEDVMFSDYKSLFYSQYDGWPHNEVFSQTAHHESDDGRKELFLSTKRLLQSAESPFHLAGDDKPRNSFPLLLFSPMMKIAASIGRNALNPYPDLDRDIAAYLDMFLNNHAVCMSRRQPQQAMASVAHMLSGYINMPSPTRLRFVGLMIQQDIPEFSAFGYKLASEAILQQHLEEYHAHKLHSSISLPLFAPVQPAGDVAAPSVRLHIVFYCEEYGNAWWPNWGPSSVRGTGRGAGGSEEAVIYIARELAAMGHLVEVYAEPSPVDHCRRLGDVSGGDADVESDAETQTPALCSCAHTDNVCWFHYSEFDVMGDSHLREDVHLYKAVNGQQSLLGSTSHTGANPIVFISWRYPLSLLLGKFRSSAPTAGGSVATHIYLWVHDLLPHLALPLPLSSTKNRDQVISLNVLCVSHGGSARYSYVLPVCSLVFLVSLDLCCSFCEEFLYRACTTSYPCLSICTQSIACCRMASPRMCLRRRGQILPGSTFPREVWLWPLTQSRLISDGMCNSCSKSARPKGITLLILSLAALTGRSSLFMEG